MPDEMFFSKDNRSLRRGRRLKSRTPTCRPCMMWPQDAPAMALEGVVIDATPCGLCIRMLESFPPGTVVMVQLMRDEDFSVPLADAMPGMVVRNTLSPDGFMDHGVQLDRVDFRRAEQSRPIRVERRRPSMATRRRSASRMHTIDLTVGGRWSGRSSR